MDEALLFVDKKEKFLSEYAQKLTEEASNIKVKVKLV